MAGGTFTGVDCDFGTGTGTDNAPQDIFGGAAYTYGNDADVVCTAAACLP